MFDILGTTFVLAVTDLQKSKAFYMNQLGFVEDFSVHGWAFLSRGACKLRIGDCPGIVPISSVPDHSWFAYLHIQDAAGFYADVRRNGVEIWHSLTDTPWGMREFSIVTPDGHRIVFGEKL